MYLKKINLKNKYALVTGAGKGLGRACSIALAEAGATIIGLSRTQSDLDKLQKDIDKVLEHSKAINLSPDRKILHVLSLLFSFTSIRYLL